MFDRSQTLFLTSLRLIEYLFPICIELLSNGTLENEPDFEKLSAKLIQAFDGLQEDVCSFIYSANGFSLLENNPIDLARLQSFIELGGILSEKPKTKSSVFSTLRTLPVVAEMAEFEQEKNYFAFFSDFIHYVVTNDKFDLYLQSYGERILTKEREAEEEARVSEEIASKANNEKPKAITMEAINEAADAARRANKAQKRLEKIKVRKTIFPSIVTLLSSYVKKKSFGLDSFFAKDSKTFFATNSLPQTLSDYFSIIVAITQANITQKDVCQLISKDLLETFADVANAAQNLFVLEKKSQIADFLCQLAEVIFSIFSFTNEQNCLKLSKENVCVVI